MNECMYIRLYKLNKRVKNYKSLIANKHKIILEIKIGLLIWLEALKNSTIYIKLYSLLHL